MKITFKRSRSLFTVIVASTILTGGVVSIAPANAGAVRSTVSLDHQPQGVLIPPAEKSESYKYKGASVVFNQPGDTTTVQAWKTIYSTSNDFNSVENILKPAGSSMVSSFGGVKVTTMATATGFQAITTITKADAPRKISFGFSVPSDLKMKTRRDGGYDFVDSHGVDVEGVKSPWARDANGKAITTHYDLADNVLTQTIDFTSTTPLPITADPEYWQIAAAGATGFAVQQAVYIGGAVLLGSAQSKILKIASSGAGACVVGLLGGFLVNAEPAYLAAACALFFGVSIVGLTWNSIRDSLMTKYYAQKAARDAKKKKDLEDVVVGGSKKDDDGDPGSNNGGTGIKSGQDKSGVGNAGYACERLLNVAFVADYYNPNQTARSIDLEAQNCESAQNAIQTAVNNSMLGQLTRQMQIFLGRNGSQGGCSLASGGPRRRLNQCFTYTPRFVMELQRKILAAEKVRVELGSDQIELEAIRLADTKEAAKSKISWRS